MPSDAPSDEPAADGCLQRAQLLAELGRYDEAVDELDPLLATEPGHAEALALLARMHLAAGRAEAALTAAEAAAAVAPLAVAPRVARGLALSDLGRWSAAARTGDEILALGPTDPYAQRSAAAILSGSRNGQPALNAAWRAVELAPEESQAHLVLALVAARLGLFDLAERAYREALRLDPELPEARHDVGVIRLERRRYAAALEEAAELAAPDLPRADAGGVPGADAGGLPGADAGDPWRGDAGGLPRADAGGLLFGGAGRAGSDALRRLVLQGAGWFLVGAVLVAFLAASAPGFSRVAAVLAALGGVLVLWRHAARLPGPRGTRSGLLRADRRLALAVYAVAAAPALLVLYALVGGVWPVVASLTAALAAAFAVLARR